MNQKEALKLAAAIIFMLIVLAGCTPQNPDCRRYTDYEQINSLMELDIGRPTEYVQEPNDCSAKYRIKDTTFNLYYWAYASDDSFYTNFNHSLAHTSNCTGSMCGQLYEFHYIGPPRGLEVKCTNGKMWMNDSGAIKEKEIECSAFKNISKNNQKTWKCDYNQIIEEHCNGT